MKTSDVAAFLSPYCGAGRKDIPPFYVRVRIGTGPKRAAKCWAYKPFPLESITAGQAAQEVIERLETERLTTTARAWIEVLEQGDSNPCKSCGPLQLEPEADDDDEQPHDERRDPFGIGKDIAKGGGAAGLVAHVLHHQGALVQDARAQNADAIRAKDAEIHRLDQRVVHLENMVDRLHKEKLTDAITIAELKAVAGGGDALSLAAKPFFEAVERSLPLILARFGGGDQAAAKPADPNAPPDPGADLDAIMAALAATLQTHPEALTKERWERFQVGYEYMRQYAASQGWS